MFTKKSVLAFLTTAVAALAIAGCSQNADAKQGAAKSNMNGPAAGKFSAPEYTMGSAAAKVQVIEYLSDTCSHCARFDAEVFPTLKRKYVDSGKVKWTIREFLTPPEQVSAAGFVLARCAGRDKYWAVIEAIFRGQEEMFKTGDVHGIFLRIAQSMGMDEKTFDACVQDDAAFKALSSRVDKAIKDGIQSTPTFIINGKKFDKGELSVGEFEKALAEAGVAVTP